MEEILAGCVDNKKFVNITFHGSCAEFPDVSEEKLLIEFHIKDCYDTFSIKYTFKSIFFIHNQGYEIIRLNTFA